MAALGGGGDSDVLFFESGQGYGFKKSDCVRSGFGECGGLEFAELRCHK